MDLARGRRPSTQKESVYCALASRQNFLIGGQGKVQR